MVSGLAAAVLIQQWFMVALTGKQSFLFEAWGSPVDGRSLLMLALLARHRWARADLRPWQRRPG